MDFIMPTIVLLHIEIKLVVNALYTSKILILPKSKSKLSYFRLNYGLLVRSIVNKEFIKYFNEIFLAFSLQKS